MAHEDWLELLPAIPGHNHAIGGDGQPTCGCQFDWQEIARRQKRSPAEVALFRAQFEGTFKVMKPGFYWYFPAPGEPIQTIDITDGRADRSAPFIVEVTRHGVWRTGSDVEDDPAGWPGRFVGPLETPLGGTGGISISSSITLRAPLDAACDNVLAWRLGEATMKAAASQEVGDYIDRGLILLRLLREAGFDVFDRKS